MGQRGRVGGLGDGAEAMPRGERWVWFSVRWEKRKEERDLGMGSGGGVGAIAVGGCSLGTYSGLGISRYSSWESGMLSGSTWGE